MMVIGKNIFLNVIMYIPNILNKKNPIIILQNIFLPSYLTYQDLRLDPLVDRHQTNEIAPIGPFCASCARLVDIAQTVSMPILVRPRPPPWKSNLGW